LDLCAGLPCWKERGAALAQPCHCIFFLECVSLVTNPACTHCTVLWWGVTDRCRGASPNGRTHHGRPVAPRRASTSTPAVVPAHHGGRAGAPSRSSPSPCAPSRLSLHSPLGRPCVLPRLSQRTTAFFAAHRRARWLRAEASAPPIRLQGGDGMGRVASDMRLAVLGQPTPQVARVVGGASRHALGEAFWGRRPKHHILTRRRHHGVLGVPLPP